MDALKLWWDNLTIEDLSRWTRQLAQFLSGSGFGFGVLTGDKWVALGGVIIAILTFLWQLKANTVPSKAAELNKSEEVVVKPVPDAAPAVKEALKP